MGKARIVLGLAYDAAGHADPDPDPSIQQAVRHRFTTFAATGSAWIRLDLPAEAGP